MVVGYDFCYDGWDKVICIRLGKVIEYYSIDIIIKWGGVWVNLESLISGMMFFISNYYSMQVGGVVFVLLVIYKEFWVNQECIDSLLQVSQCSMVYNVIQGFGDGGYFVEGDGMGFMVIYIIYFIVLQGWKNVLGKDFVGV